MKKFFLLKLDKNQNCRSFTHESLAIPRSDHHSHSLFGLMGLVVVGGVGRVGVKGPEYEKLSDGSRRRRGWSDPLTVQNGLRLILSNFWTPSSPVHNTTGRAKNLGLTPRNGTLLKITIFYFLLLFSKNGRNFLPFVSYTFENFFKTCLSFLSFCSIIRVLPVPLF